MTDTTDTEKMAQALSTLTAVRTALVEVDDAFSEVLAAHDAARAQPDRGLLTGTHPDGRPYALHGTPESVEAVSDLIEAHAQPASVADIEPMLLALTRGDSTVEEIEARQAIRAAFKKAQPASATDDRAMLLNLMQQFDSQSWECPRCGHGEDCATMDMASELRNYLAAPQPAKESE